MKDPHSSTGETTGKHLPSGVVTDTQWSIRGRSEIKHLGCVRVCVCECVSGLYHSYSKKFSRSVCSLWMDGWMVSACVYASECVFMILTCSPLEVSQTRIVLSWEQVNRCRA